MSAAAPSAFADRLIARARALGHPLCVGLDPHLERIPPCFARGSMAPRDPQTAGVVEAFLRAVLERTAARAVAIKPQIAFFEQLGWRGMRVLERIVAQARAADVPVVLDAKRGDIGSTARSYARAYLAADAVLPVDAITVNPYLGRDSLAPLIEAAHESGAGLFVLVKTSNPGSGDYQGQRVGERKLYEVVASSLAEQTDALRGAETGWSSLGVVVGATYPGEAERVRELLPRALFLVPGYGTQGATAAEAVRGFVPGPGGLEGGIVNASRAILFPAGSDTDDPRRFERALDDALARAVDELGAAVAAKS